MENQGDNVMLLLIGLAIAFAIQYFLIRGAIVSALNKKLSKQTASEDDLSLIQTKLLIEIAKKQGVDQSTIDVITGEGEKVLKPKF